ncbi:MAG: permease-like cell division protein FtsX [Muribaculaceae bacterium]|nr:permease-like cell division protein FtsX [Muribaculaceae bacterium]MDE6346207.1 permease-like cell division protein FtsX [Muribaculaceae bacterium]
MSETNKRTSLMSFGKHLTSTVSVGMVLLILGIVGCAAFAAGNITRHIRENLGFNMVMRMDADLTQINEMKKRLTSSEFVASYDYMSPEEILEQENAYLGSDVEELLGANPYQPEFNVRVKAQYASVDSLNKIISPLRECSSVEEITVHTEMVESINANIGSLSIVLVALAGALLVISFVLINNTVRLTIYSARFLLHTMRLVGATNAFIRRPIVAGNILNGILAAVVAILFLCLLRIYAVNIDPDLELALPWGDLIWVFAGVVAGGILICGTASWIATNKYLRQSYDDMF